MIVLLEFYKSHLSEYLPIFRGMVDYFAHAATIFTPPPKTQSYWWEQVNENVYLPLGLRERMDAFLGRKYKSCRVLRTVPDDETQPVVEDSSPIYMIVEF